MATEESGNLKIMEETPPTTSTEQEPKKKRPGPCNPDQAIEFGLQTTQCIDRFMSKVQHESDTIEENYQVLTAEYHHSLCIIEDYFKQANRKLVLELIDDTICKLIRTTTPKDAADKEKCPDPRVSTENLMTGHRALNRLAALPNFKDIEGAEREEVLTPDSPCCYCSCSQFPCFPGLQITSTPISVSAQTLHLPPHPVTNTSSPLSSW